MPYPCLDPLSLLPALQASNLQGNPAWWSLSNRCVHSHTRFTGTLALVVPPRCQHGLSAHLILLSRPGASHSLGNWPWILLANYTCTSPCKLVSGKRPVLAPTPDSWYQAHGMVTLVPTVGADAETPSLASLTLITPLASFWDTYYSCCSGWTPGPSPTPAAGT